MEQQIIPDGYKQTEVGVIPENWELTIIDEVVSKGILDKPLDGNHGDIHPKSGDFVNDGIPFVMANNVQNGHINLKKCSHITKKQADSLQKGFSKTGDVLLTHKATIGNTAIVGEIQTEYIMLTPQVTYYRVLNTDLLNNEYLRHFMDGEVFQTELASASGGGTRSYIGITAQRKLPIILPPLEEQTAIANALSDVDALIASIEKLIAKKQAIKTATMQQLLTGKKRLPPFNKHPDGTPKGTQQTELGEIPEDWEVVLASELVDFFGGFGFSSRSASKNGIRWLKIANVGINEIKWDTDSYLPESLSDEYKDYLLKEKDVVMALTRPLLGDKLKIARLCKDDLPALLNQRVAKLKTKVGNDLSYVFYISQRADFIAEMNLAMAGTDPPNIGTNALCNIKVLKPSSYDEQIAISGVLTDIDNELESFIDRLAKTQQIKQGMMQELLTGKTRLV